MRGIGIQELAIVLVIILILFGPKQLPKLGKMFGRTMKNVKDGMEGKFEDEPEEKTDELPAAASSEAKSAEKAKDESEV